MRTVLKACDLEGRFPILAVENNCIVSKDADITVAFEVELPELYTVTAAEYEAIHGTSYPLATTTDGARSSIRLCGSRRGNSRNVCCRICCPIRL